MKFVVCVWWFSMFAVYSQDMVQVEETKTELCNNGSENSCEAFNNTEFSTVPSVDEETSEVVRTSVTPKKPKTTTVKPKKAQAPANSTSKPQPRSDCTCDLTRGACEINCCCDVDCNSEQRAVFTHCITVPQAVDSNHCFPLQLVYHNNTDYKAVETEPGVMCVVQENTFASTDFVDVPVIKTIAALKKKLGRRKYYSWSNPPPSFPSFDVDTSYSNGSPLWIVKNSTITYLELPTSVGHSSVCHGTVMSKYLENTVTSCTRPLSSEADCLSLTNIDFTVISSSRNYNFTKPQECSEDVCLPIHWYICSKSCVEANISYPRYDKRSSTCQNLMVSVEFKIHHNGSQGVVEVNGFYTLRNVTVKNNQLFRQQYKVTYVWATKTDEAVFERSGRPGYETGKPVISGRKTAKSIVFNSSMTEWISVGFAGSSGHCTDRNNLHFGENLHTTCILKVSGNCKTIQQQIWQQLLGPKTNVTELVVSSYGDPHMGVGDAWVPVLVSDSPPLPAITTAVDIVILYSLVGSVARPQAKIISTYVELLPAIVTCDTNQSTVVVVETSVKFIDKTTPAVTKFAQPPVYEIKLPQDFFYPFLSSGNQNNCVGTLLFVISTILVLK